jgi:hypothetical protein
MLTTELMQKALPRNMKGRVDQKFVDKLNGALTDPDVAEMLRDNIIGYADVLANGRWKLDDYINAVKYVSFKTMGKNNIQAFVAAFPDRYNKYVANGTSNKDIATYVAAYNGGKLVNIIYEQTLTPTWILNAEVHQKAINRLADLMCNAQSEKVQSDSANALLTHLKRPETQKVELDIAVKEGGMIQELNHTMQVLAAKQQELISSGAYTAKEIAHQSILIEGECEHGE